MSRESVQQQLFSSIDRGDADKVSDLISEGADVNSRAEDPDGETPLIRAVAAGQRRIVKLLIGAGADVNCPARINGATPLMIASGSPDIMQDLIVAGANLNARTVVQELISPISGKTIFRGGETALHLAAAANKAEAARVLVRAGAEIEPQAADGLAPLDYALRFGRPTEVATVLAEAGAKLTPKRMELMHSTAHTPESDLWEFPWANEKSNDGQTHQGNVSEENGISSNPDARPHCPKCGFVFYSRRTRICERCGYQLPREMLLTDREARIKDEQRKWARDLAGKFNRDPSGVKGTFPSKAWASSEHMSPLQLVSRASGGDELRQRNWSIFWISVSIYAALLAGLILLLNSLGPVPPEITFFMFAVFVISCTRKWRSTGPRI